MSFTQTSERLFVSITLPPPCQDAIAELMEPLEGVRWTLPAQLHLTLRFLGDVLEDQAQQMAGKLASVQVDSFILTLDGLGVFPPRGAPRILWVGLGNAHTRLFQLRQQVDDAVLAAGWRGDLRTFEPHITIGRVVDATPTSIEAWLRRHRDFAGPAFRVKSFQLMASELRSNGPAHRLHTDFKLGE
jgi:RNA 2',3'-cyclic 3'-phosphodiesterase